jgi:hypothetical protein
MLCAASLEARVHPLCHRVHLRRCWRRERVKLQRSVSVSHVHAIEGERLQLHVQPQRAVTSLHEGHKSRVRFAHARKTELPLGALPQLRRQ